MITYSTNWMGPINLHWYRDRGLLEEGSVEPTTYYSAGRIDIRGVPDEPWGLEYSLPPMHGEDWNDFGDWLESFQTHELWEFDKLIACYEAASGRKIRWADSEEERLRSKKKLIHDELYDKVGRMSGDHDKYHMTVEAVKPEVPGTIKNMDHEQLKEYAWWLYKRVGELERERKFSKVSRVEVIGPEKREYVRYFNEEEFMNWGLQDDDRTLKIFITNENNDE